MLAIIARRVATKAIVRGAMVGAVMSVDGIPFTDLRGKLPTRQDIHYGVREESRIEGAVFHHTATRGQTLTSIAQYHIEARKWPGIAYHYAIGYDGHVFLLNDPTTISYHTQGYNSRTISIVLIGNYQNNDLSDEMKRSIIVLSSYLNTLYDLQFMWMHSETKSTACPGRHAREYLQPILHGPRP